MKKALFLLSFLYLSAFATQTSDLPFVSTVTKLQAAISGPFAMAVCVIFVVVTGGMLIMGEWGDTFKKVLQVAIGIGVTLGAVSLITGLFGASGTLF